MSLVHSLRVVAPLSPSTTITMDQQEPPPPDHDSLSLFSATAIVIGNGSPPEVLSDDDSSLLGRDESSRPPPEPSSLPPDTTLLLRTGCKNHYEESAPMNKQLQALFLTCSGLFHSDDVGARPHHDITVEPYYIPPPVQTKKNISLNAKRHGY
jgi:hypothetical protein